MAKKLTDAQKFNKKVRNITKALSDQMMMELILYGHTVVFLSPTQAKIMNTEDLADLVKWRRKNFIKPKKPPTKPREE